MASSSARFVEVRTAADVLDLVGRGLDPDRVGVLAGQPMVAVHLDGAPEELRVAAIAPRLACVMVGVAENPSRVAVEFDVMLSAEPDSPAPWVGCADGFMLALEELATAVVRNPRAAVTLVQTLRIGAGLPIVDALTLESLSYGVLQSGPEHASWLASRSLWQRPPVEEEPVLVTRSGAELTVTLHRPRLRNSYNTAMRDALVDALRLAVADPTIQSILLRGDGLSFCCGGDLREFGTTPDAVTAHLVRSTRSAASWLARCAPRLTAALHGPVIGAGIELAAFATRVIAAGNTTIRLPEIAMGLIPGAGGTVSIPHRIGRARAAYVMLTGAEIDCSTAQAWGLIDTIST